MLHPLPLQSWHCPFGLSVGSSTPLTRGLKALAHRRTLASILGYLPTAGSCTKTPIMAMLPAIITIVLPTILNSCSSWASHTYRLSIAWPRVLPRAAVRLTKKGLILRSPDRPIVYRKIEPWLCLYHWDLLQALDDMGGWTHRDSAGWFTDHAALIGRRYGDRVKHFATFNEPSVSAIFGYLLGYQCPRHYIGAAIFTGSSPPGIWRMVAQARRYAVV